MTKQRRWPAVTIYAGVLGVFAGPGLSLMIDGAAVWAALSWAVFYVILLGGLLAVAVGAAGLAGPWWARVLIVLSSWLLAALVVFAYGVLAIAINGFEGVQ